MNTKICTAILLLSCATGVPLVADENPPQMSSEARLVEHL